MQLISKHITLKHLLIHNQKIIGIQFYPDKVIQAFIKELPNLDGARNMIFVYIVYTQMAVNNLKSIKNPLDL